MISFLKCLQATKSVDACINESLCGSPDRNSPCTVHTLGLQLGSHIPDTSLTSSNRSICGSPRNMTTVVGFLITSTWSHFTTLLNVNSLVLLLSNLPEEFDRVAQVLQATDAPTRHVGVLLEAIQRTKDTHTTPFLTSAYPFKANFYRRACRVEIPCRS